MSWSESLRGITHILDPNGVALPTRKTLQVGAGMGAIDDGTKTIISSSGGGGGGGGGGIEDDVVLFDKFATVQRVTSASSGVLLGNGIGTLNWNAVTTFGGSLTGGSDFGDVQPLSTSGGLSMLCNSGHSGVWLGQDSDTPQTNRGFRANQIKSFEVILSVDMTTSSGNFICVAVGVDAAVPLANSAQTIGFRMNPVFSTDVEVLRRQTSGSTAVPLSASVDIASSTISELIAVKFEQNLDESTGLGDNTWNFFINNFAVADTSDVAGPDDWDSAPGTPVLVGITATGAGGHTSKAVVNRARVVLFGQTIAQMTFIPD